MDWLWTRTQSEAFNTDQMRRLTTEGMLLEHAAKCEANFHKTNGVIEPHLLEDLWWKIKVKKPALQRAALEGLLSAGWWHDPVSAYECGNEYCVALLDVIGPLPEGCYLIHRFTEHQFTTDEVMLPVSRKHRIRANDLKKDYRLVKRIVDRDGTLCRYCGERLKRADHKSDLGFTYDHVDPDGGNSLKNVVVCCKRCNGFKDDRLPEEAGMILLPPRSTVGDAVRIWEEEGRDPVPHWIGTGFKPAGSSRDQASRAGAREVGPDRIQTGSGPDLIGVGSNGNGHGSQGGSDG